MHGTADLFAPFTKAAQNIATCVTITYPPRRILLRHEYIKLIEEALPITTDFWIIAESFSGSLAIEVAARSTSKHLKGLVLCATFASPPISPALIPFARLLAPIFLRLPPPEWAIRQFMLEQNSPPDLVNLVKTALHPISGSVLTSRLKIVLHDNTLDLAQKIKIPTLILIAAKDRLVSPQASKNLIAAIPHATVTRLNAPHLLLQTRPTEAMNAIIRQ